MKRKTGIKMKQLKKLQLNFQEGKLKKLLQMSLATLKEYSRRPELVEWEDVTAKDPKF